MNIKEIDRKWQERWEKDKTFEAAEMPGRKKYYCLIEFPYPSGEGLHVGHTRPYIAMDIIARKRRMEGYNVLFPMGWDAFGLPAENYAIKNNISPKTATLRNIANYKRQLKMLGMSFDWSREISTADPGYYKWTQWIFLKLFEKGLAYKAEVPVNWCTSCKTGLANEEVTQGACERCGAPVMRKNRKQWMLRITAYADRLIDDLDLIDYPERVKAQQINWIGKSEGAEIRFSVKNEENCVMCTLPVFTTRPDTIFGVTYMVISPEHPMIDKSIEWISNADEVLKYREQALKKSDIERMEGREKSGIRIKGLFAVNPAASENIPIWTSDYVLTTYGTGAIMAVPAHDRRDHEFARKYDLPIRQVISGGNIKNAALADAENGALINSGFLNGLSGKDAILHATKWIADHGFGNAKIYYKLRDWVFSRQRYWGEPIPVVECGKCGFVPVPEAELPLVLPEVEKAALSDSGESMLSEIDSWVNTECPECGGKAKRETDTMPNWAGSSWYYLRYCDPHNDKVLADPEKMNYWMPVDWYNGGMEHTTLHLLYSRFWHKFLYDTGIVTTKEPYLKRTSHGMVLGDTGEKMSKSRGNVVNPDDIVNEHGADVFRMTMMSSGAFDKTGFWKPKSLPGIKRFLLNINLLSEKIDHEDDIEADNESLRITHKTIKEVTERVEKTKFNTAVVSLKVYCNYLSRLVSIPKTCYETMLLLLYPFCPHIACEIWEREISKDKLIYDQEWPEYDPELIREDIVTIAIQINGKMRGTADADADIEEDDLVEMVRDDKKTGKYLKDKKIKKTIYIKGKIINIIV